MDNDQVELAAKDVFVLMDVPKPDHLDIENKRCDLTHDTQDSENDSQTSLDSDEHELVDIVTDSFVVDLTPPEELDNSSSDSKTKSELEEERWYNPKLNSGLEKYDFDSLKETLKAIRNTTPEQTREALFTLSKCKISDESFQNMFITQNGFEVLINLLNCNNISCMKEALNIIHIMSSCYKVQSQLSDLNAVEPLLNILLFNNNPELKKITVGTLHNIAKLKKGRKLIRLTGGIPVLVQTLNQSKSVILTSKQNPNTTRELTILMTISCVSTLCLLCKSLKSQKYLWNSKFKLELPPLLSMKQIEIQVQVMSLITECCRLRPNAVNLTLVEKCKEIVKELNILPRIVQLMLGARELAKKAAEITLCMFNGHNYIYDVLLKQKGLHVIFKVIEKLDLSQSRDMASVMESIITILWKCSLNENCREVMEKHGIARVLSRLLTYKYNDRVVGYAVAALSELWKCESLQPQLKQEALPKYLELLDSSLHSLVMAHVCTALARASECPDCVKTIDEANGFRKVFTLLPSLEMDEFDKYDDVFEPETTIAAVECLAQMIENTQPEQNNLKGMYEALCDLVDLLKHKNPNILAAVCWLIEAVSNHDENLKIMIDAGVIENLANLMTTTHVNLRANLCRVLGKYCVSETKGCIPSCAKLLDQLWTYAHSGQQIVIDNVPLALNGLSKDPINCIKIETIGFIPFLIESIESDNEKTSAAAISCLRNMRKTCTGIGHYTERTMKN